MNMKRIKMEKPIIILISALLLLNSCSNKKKIIGTWQDQDRMTWVFNDKGILAWGRDREGYTEIDFKRYNYKIKGNKLIFVIPQDFTDIDVFQTFKMSFSSDRKTLTLKEGLGVDRWLNGPEQSENTLTKISDESEYIQGVLFNNYLPQVKEKKTYYYSDTVLFNDIRYNDKNGNQYYQYDNRQKVNCTLLNVPDIGFLLQLKDNLVVLTINSKKVKDISFLKNFPKLKELYILESNISSLEPVKYLENLETIYIASGFPKVIDCSVFKELNIKYINDIDFSDNKVENIGAIYHLATWWTLDKIKGFRDYYDKYKSLWGSKSYVFHYNKYHILQNGVMTRAEPDENSDVIAELNLNDEIQIIEYTNKEEKINDVWGYWYKIKHNNITGYIFGGYIAAETLITDIDKNGIKDYFYLRHSSKSGIYPDKDIFIYINDQKIDTGILSATKRYYNSPFKGYEIIEENGYVLIILKQYGREDSEITHNFKVLPNGKIEHIKTGFDID